MIKSFFSSSSFIFPSFIWSKISSASGNKFFKSSSRWISSTGFSSVISKSSKKLVGDCYCCDILSVGGIQLECGKYNCEGEKLS